VQLVVKTGILYIVATPIGNLEDITLRALRVLKEVELVAAEDTRHSRKLLSHFGISKPLTSYFDHNHSFKGDYILERIRSGESVALISDAGTPGISDPGYMLVRDALAAGIRVVPIPGPCAAIAALSAAGLPTDSFSFIGFLPNRSGKRQDRLVELKNERRVLIFYEAANRLQATLGDMAEIFGGERQVVVARELSKIYEEFLRASLTDMQRTVAERKLRGEVVLLVAPPVESVAIVENSPVELLRTYLVVEGMSLKDAVARVVQETGTPRGIVYAAALAVKDGSDQAI
jgi:16S rRNA (cytidine1402-2'-O)-methyltransferase